MTEIEHAARRRAFTSEEALKLLEKIKFPNGFTGCWLWMGNRDQNGYARVYFDGQTKHVHRLVCERLKSDYDATLQVGHSCPNRHCLNPAHLSMVTRPQNLEGRQFNKLKKKSTLFAIAEIITLMETNGIELPQLGAYLPDPPASPEIPVEA